MKKLIFLGVMTLLCLPLNGQSAQTISRYWTAFTQKLDIESQSSRKFKLIASAKVVTDDENAWSGIWARVDNKNNENGFFDNMGDRPIKSNTWQTYEIIGEIDQNTKSLNFGGLCLYNGKFYFDKFELYIENENGIYEATEIYNSSFESNTSSGIIPKWDLAVRSNGRQFKVKEFDNSNTQDSHDGKMALLIEGKGIDYIEDGIIGKKDSATPQIDAMISMLEDLKSRVVQQTQTLSQYEIDHLHDDKANRIGTLIMHLAAAEAFYQVFTFEGRTFNEEEKKKWELALDLGPKAQEKFQGNSVRHYLDIYDEVRKKTITELKKRDDKWFEEIQPSYGWSNQYCWFHVMEHQSSHLGQILFLEKRIPPEEELILTPDLKD